MNKSLLTNVVALVFVVVGCVSPWGGDAFFAIGIFALSGAVTNWLAVYMLFERVPFLYGSGVIPQQFESIKVGIKKLVMAEFFREEKITQFFADSRELLIGQVNMDQLVEKVDLDRVFDALVKEILSSSIGSMLGMFGGDKLLEQYREPIKGIFQQYIREEFTQEKLNEMLSAAPSAHVPQMIVARLDALVEDRLSELTSDQVKRIVQDMIRAHLGWLVVWGGVFGGAIGLLVSLQATFF